MEKLFAYVQFLLYLCTLFMQISDLEILFGHHPEVGLIRRELKKGQGNHVLLSGLYASARAFTLAQMTKEPLFVILDNAESSQYLYGDLKVLGSNVLFFPAAQKRRTMDESAMVQRTECLRALASGRVQIEIGRAHV